MRNPLVFLQDKRQLLACFQNIEHNKQSVYTAKELSVVRESTCSDNSSTPLRAMWLLLQQQTLQCRLKPILNFPCALHSPLFQSSHSSTGLLAVCTLEGGQACARARVIASQKGLQC